LTLKFHISNATPLGVAEGSCAWFGDDLVVTAKQAAIQPKLKLCGATRTNNCEEMTRVITTAQSPAIPIAEFDKLPFSCQSHIGTKNLLAAGTLRGSDATDAPGYDSLIPEISQPQPNQRHTQNCKRCDDVIQDGHGEECQVAERP